MHRVSMVDNRLDRVVLLLVAAHHRVLDDLMLIRLIMHHLHLVV